MHHTNIVPVYGIGEADGVHYYAMQFIDGLGLDRVLSALRHARSQQTLSTDQVDRTGKPTKHADETQLDKTLDFDLQQNFPELYREQGLQADSSATMDMLSGTQIIQSGTSLGDRGLTKSYWKHVASIGEQVARALEHAHSRGILHRDIKPGNLILDARDNVWVTDFGLAKSEDDHELTQQGEWVGTLYYMAPESFRGKTDRQSDIYGLGITLYELLAFRRAFDRQNRNELIEQLINSQAPRLRSVNPDVPVDLETIVHTAIAKEPADRYLDAEELANDLQRFINDEPIRARKIGLLERGRRWGRKNPVLAASLSAVAVLLIVLATGSAIAANYFRQLSTELGVAINRAEQQSETNRQLAEDKTELAKQFQQAAADEVRARGSAEAMLADVQTGRGFLADQQHDPATAMLWFANAAMASPTDQARQESNLRRAGNWKREVVVPVAAVHANGKADHVASHPGDLTILLAIREDRSLLLWDWSNGKTLPWSDQCRNANDACWILDQGQSYVAVGFDSGVRVYRVPSGEVVYQQVHSAPVMAVAYSPRGKLLAVASRELRLGNPFDSSAELQRIPEVDDAVALKFFANGQRLIASGSDGVAQVWDVASQQPTLIFAPNHQPRVPSSPVLVKNESELITVISAEPGELGWWNPDTGKLIRTRKTVPSGLNQVVASNDGQQLATCGYSSGQVWDADDVDSDGQVYAHGNDVPAVTFSPDDSTLVSVSWDRTARFWPLTFNGRNLRLPHMDMVRDVMYSSDGRFVITVQEAGLIRVWDQSLPRPRLWATEPCGWNPRFSPNGRWIAPSVWHASPYGRTHQGFQHVTVLDSDSGKPAGPAISLGKAFLVDSEILSDNRRVVVASVLDQTGTLSIFDVTTGKQMDSPISLPGVPRRVAARPNQPQVAVLCRNGKLLLINADDGSIQYELDHERWIATDDEWIRVGWTPDGSSMITVTPGADNVVCVRDGDTGKLRYPPIEPVLKHGPCRDIDISRDGRLLATAVNVQNAVQVWDLQSGKAVSEPLAHPGGFYGLFTVSLSPDGRFVLTGGTDGELRLWNWRTGKLQIPSMRHPDEVYSANFTSDGRYGVSICRDGKLRLWDLADAKQMAAAVDSMSSSFIHGCAMHGARVAFGNMDNECRVADLAPLLEQQANTTEPNQLLLQAELISSGQVQLGEVTRLNSDQWMERFLEYESH